MLVNELKKIEARKKERDRKTQDLQKLISQADQVNTKMENPKFICRFYQKKIYLQQGDPAPNPPSNRKQDKKLNKKKLQNQIRPSRVDSMVNVCVVLLWYKIELMKKQTKNSNISVGKCWNQIQ